MDAFRTLLGARIKAFRKKLGMNQAQLAEASGVEINTISRYETGSYAPSVEQLLGLAAALKVSPIAILSTDDYVSQQPSERLKDAGVALVQAGLESQNIFASRMDVFRKLLGARIRQARETKGMNQAELANAAGFEVKTISRYETGTTAPSVEHLLNLSNALGVSPMELLPPQDPALLRRLILRKEITDKIMQIESISLLEKISLLANSNSSHTDDFKK